jgi:hypothetical protein
MKIKKSPVTKKKKELKKPLETSGTKVVVGEDEFCPTCMEWRAYDEATGKCVVCGRLIRKTAKRSGPITEEYDLKDFTVEHDESQDTGED